MRLYRVVWSKQARTDLMEVCAYIIESSGFHDRAEDYYKRVIKFGDALETSPHRGSSRDDLVQGLRLIPFQKTAILAIMIDEDAGVVKVTNFFYGGRDVDALLSTDRSIG